MLPENLTFQQVKFKVQAGKASSAISIGHLNATAFPVASVNLVIAASNASTLKLSIQGFSADQGVLCSGEFTIPSFIIKGSLKIHTKSANSPSILPPNSEPMVELTSLKDPKTGIIPGRLHMVSFTYTAPIIDEQMVIIKHEQDLKNMPEERAMFHRFFTALFDWQGGEVKMLFMDEGNEVEVVDKALGMMREACA